MSLESKIKNQPFAVRRVVLASGWRQGLTSLFKVFIKKIVTTIFVVKSLEGFGWNNVGQGYISIESMYRVIWCRQDVKASPA